MIDIARTVAQEAGTVLMERFGRLSGAEIERHGRRDVTTAADQAAEQHILRRLREARPDIPILGEESVRGTDVRAPEGLCWIVDPLDGTVNFVQGIPLFAVSIGLVEDGKPLLGVVHVPALDQTFWGGPGSGCFEGERPVSVSATPMLQDAVVATGFAYRRDETADNNVENVQRMIMRTRGIRRMGAAALDLAYVASGRLDGFWELHLEPWDVAAGAALIRAAGGVVTDQDGGEDWLFGRHIVATNGMLHNELRTALVPRQEA
ncbi:MAG: inositol monophosphatase family protein [Planctomycetota bacterium]|nr:inositol monophosphatase family protein [Planctomycetota bacterium]